MSLVTHADEIVVPAAEVLLVYVDPDWCSFLALSELFPLPLLSFLAYRQEALDRKAAEEAAAAEAAAQEAAKSGKAKPKPADKAAPAKGGAKGKDAAAPAAPVDPASLVPAPVFPVLPAAPVVFVLTAKADATLPDGRVLVGECLID